MRAAEQKRPDAAARRFPWKVGMVRLPIDKLLFPDETRFKTNMTRLRGRCPRNERLVEFVPRGHWKTTTFLCGLRVGGPVAPLVIDGAVNGDLFKGRVGQHLVRELSEGDMVVMDSLGSHKVAGVREAIAGAGAQAVYLPPYSPDLDPIETAFSKLKRLVRTAARRTVTGLEPAIADAFDRPTASDCRNYFAHCGYTLDAA